MIWYFVVSFSIFFSFITFIFFEFKFRFILFVLFVREFTNSNSIDSYFLANAQGLRLDQISAFDNETITDAYVDIGNTFGYPHQQAFLGYESWIIEPDSFEDNNTSYTSNIAPGTFNQTYYSISRGYNGKLTANIGAQYSEKIYLGLNVNGHFVDYDN